MEPVTIATFYAAAFVVALPAFIRQLLSSRDKCSEDMTQQNALEQEEKELENLHNLMASNKRFDSHYQVLSTNKETIQCLDQKIEDIPKKKSDLIQRYAKMTIKESLAIIGGECKVICDKLKKKIDSELKFYDRELDQLQNQRISFGKESSVTSK